MNKKYHIRPDGTIGECKAIKGKCKYNILPEEHFATASEARIFNDKRNEMLSNIENINVNNLIEDEKVLNILNNIQQKGGSSYFVGGFVRDKLLNKPSKDIDIEIHNISENDFKKIVSNENIVIDEVGKAFGVYKYKDIDFSFPRTEVQTGNKHTDFEITVNPFISTKEASERRDFTINSLMLNTQTNELIDHHNGLNDLINKTIRHIDDKKFQEDSLRVLRAAQFASRFDFKIADNTMKLIENIDLKHLPKERFFEEFKKAFSKGDHQKFLNILYQTKFNEIATMDDVDYIDDCNDIDLVSYYYKPSELYKITETKYYNELSDIIHNYDFTNDNNVDLFKYVTTLRPHYVKPFLKIVEYKNNDNTLITKYDKVSKTFHNGNYFLEQGYSGLSLRNKLIEDKHRKIEEYFEG